MITLILLVTAWLLGGVLAFLVNRRKYHHVEDNAFLGFLVLGLIILVIDAVVDTMSFIGGWLHKLNTKQ